MFAQFEVSRHLVDMKSLVEQEAGKVVLQQVKGIKRCMLIDRDNEVTGQRELHLVTEGINLQVRGCERREQLVLPVVRLCVLVGAVRVSAAAHTMMTHLSLVFLQSETQEYLCYLYATSARHYLSSIFILPSSHCSFFKLMGCCGLVSHWLLPSSISFGLHWLFHLHKLLTVFGALPSAFFGPIFNLQVAIWVDVFDFVGKWAHCMLF